MKKKLLSVLLSAAMVMTLLAGCGGTTEEAPVEEAPATSEEAPVEEAPVEEAPPAEEAATGGFHFEIVSKGFQHQFWQAVLQGAEEKAAELGDTINFVGPNSESDIADQVQMLQNAINAAPDAIGLAALDTEACIDSISAAQAAGLPIIGFDSGVPGAPAGSIWANASTDNYNAGVLAAEETYKLIEGKLAAGTRIGVLGQDATSESIVNRGLGFIDKMAELITAAGLTVTVEGNDKYVTDCAVDPVDGADVVIEVLVPASVTSELSATDCTTLLNKEDTICIYGSNQHSAEAMVTADQNIGKFGDTVVGIGFDAGALIKGAVKDGTLAGAVTQAPLEMGRKVVELLHAAASGETVADVDTGCQWYTAENMEDPNVAPNLYD